MAEKIWRIIRHNQAFAVGIVLCIVVAVWAYGCQTTAVSILNPPSKVSRAQLHAEVDTFLAQAKLKFEAMDRQDEIKSTVFNAALNYIQGGAVNPYAVALTLGNILGLGAIIDNRRKDVVIKTLKNDKVT